MSGRDGRASFGLCMGPDAVYAVKRIGARVVATQVVPAPVVEDAPPHLVEALTDLLSHLDEPNGAHLSIALLPSLAPGRILALGDVPAGALTTDPRHSSLEHGVVTRREITSAGEEYVAHCSPHVLTQVADSLQAGRSPADAIAPADHAWSAAVGKGRGGPEDRGLCVVQLAGALPETRILAVVSGEPVALRRLPHDAAAATLASVLRAMARSLEQGEERNSLLALGDPTFRDTIHNAGSTAGLAISSPQGLLADLQFDPGFVAAAYAGAGPRFVPPEVVTAALARRLRRTVGMVAAAVVLLGMAGALRTLGVSRELNDIRAARAEVQGQVDGALTMTNEAAGLSGSLATLRDLRAAAPRWSSVLTDLSERIPDGTYATAVRTVGDSIYMEMEGEDAARAFEGIRGMRGLEAFRAAAPVRREVGEGSRVIERFAAAATVSWPRPNESDGGPP